MTDPRYPGWDHPVTLADSEDDHHDASDWFGPRPDGVPGPALVLALVVGVVVVIVGGLWLWGGR